MTVIHKYPITGLASFVELRTSHLVRILHVATQLNGAQKEAITFWAEVDPNLSQSTSIRIIGTGPGFQVPGQGWTHIGTCLMQSGLVWHVYINNLDVDTL